MALVRAVADRHAAAGQRDVARLCGGLPPALRIAADQLHDSPDLPAEVLAARLDRATARLDLLVTGDRQVGIRSVLATSYADLDPESARALRLLSLHQGVQIREGADAALLDRPVRQAGQLLRGLTERHLLEPIADGFRLRDLTRLYASERLAAQEPPEEARRCAERLFSWYLAGLRAANVWLAPHRPAVDAARVPAGLEPVRPGSYLEAVAWCDTEFANMVAAVRQAVALGLDDLACRLAGALWGYFDLRRQWTEWLATHEAGLAAARRIANRTGEGRSC